MSHTMASLCGACLMGFAKEETDYRFGFLFLAVLSGFAACVLFINGL